MNGHHEHDTDNKARRSPPVVTVDYDLYASYLADSGLTEGQKREYIETLWSIVCDFVALGFNVHPVQQAGNPCGQLSASRRISPISSENAVQSNQSNLTSEFSNAAGGNAPKAAERIQE